MKKLECLMDDKKPRYLKSMFWLITSLTNYGALYCSFLERNNRMIICESIELKKQTNKQKKQDTANSEGDFKQLCQMWNEDIKSKGDKAAKGVVNQCVVGACEVEKSTKKLSRNWLV